MQHQNLINPSQDQGASLPRIFKSNSQPEQDQSSQTFSPTKTDSQSEDDIFSTFVKEVKPVILGQSDAEDFDSDQLTSEIAKEEYLRH